MRQLLLTSLLLAGTALHAQSPKYDLVIRGGIVIDGTGAPRYPADIAVRGDRIALISPAGIPAAEAATLIDGSGCAPQTRVSGSGFVPVCSVERARSGGPAC